MKPPVSAETPQASPPDQASPTRLFPWPGESCCTGMPQMPLTCSPAPEAFPWRRARHGRTAPDLFLAPQALPPLTVTDVTQLLRALVPQGPRGKP